MAFRTTARLRRTLLALGVGLCSAAGLWWAWQQGPGARAPGPLATGRLPMAAAGASPPPRGVARGRILRPAASAGPGSPPLPLLLPLPDLPGLTLPEAPEPAEAVLPQAAPAAPAALGATLTGPAVAGAAAAGGAAGGGVTLVQLGGAVVAARLGVDYLDSPPVSP